MVDMVKTNTFIQHLRFTSIHFIYISTKFFRPMSLTLFSFTALLVALSSVSTTIVTNRYNEIQLERRILQNKINPERKQTTRLRQIQTTIGTTELVFFSDAVMKSVRDFVISTNRFSFILPQQFTHLSNYNSWQFSFKFPYQ